MMVALRLVGGDGGDDVGAAHRLGGARRRRRSRARARRRAGCATSLAVASGVDVEQAHVVDAEQVVEGERLELALRAVADQRHHAAVGPRQAPGGHHRRRGGAHRGGQREFAEQHRAAGVDVGEHAERHHGGQAGAGVLRVAVDVLEAVEAARPRSASARSRRPASGWRRGRDLSNSPQRAKSCFEVAHEGAEAGGQALRGDDGGDVARGEQGRHGKSPLIVVDRFFPAARQAKWAVLARFDQ